MVTQYNPNQLNSTNRDTEHTVIRSGFKNMSYHSFSDLKSLRGTSFYKVRMHSIDGMKVSH